MKSLRQYSKALVASLLAALAFGAAAAEPPNHPCRISLRFERGSIAAILGIQIVCGYSQIAS